MVANEPIAALVVDPPWMFDDNIQGNGRGAESHYDCMTLEQLMEFELPLLADDCYLFLWRVSAMVESAYDVLRCWGFTPKSEIVWLKKTVHGKRHFGMGHHVRAEHESCIIAVRGRPKPTVRNVRSTFEGKTGRHSEKPLEFYSLVERLCPGPYGELFARRRRDGWQQWGHELEGVQDGQEQQRSGTTEGAGAQASVDASSGTERSAANT